MSNTPLDSAEELILRARGGDRAAREALVAQHLPALRGFVRLRIGRALRSREESVDLVQSICGEALADLAGFEYRGPQSFRHWLLRRAENKIRARGRFWSRARRTRTREAPAAGPDAQDLREVAGGLTPSREAASREELERLETAFTGLPDDYRRVILLARVAGLSHEEIAEEMGRTPVATRTLLSRALSRLATALED